MPEQSLVGGDAHPGALDLAGAGLPAELREFIHKVHQHAYRITDADVEALRERGYSEDQFFELIAAAAVGVARRRLEAGLALLEFF